MPVGFENSALKMSFSLSSLQSGGAQGSPQQVMMQVERPYHSLNKKTRGNLEREMWRRSWGTQEEKKDDFWAALQPNYNYLMDNNLIESCKEAHGELSCDEEETALLSKWSFKDFTAQFSELCSWLNHIQEAVYGKEENIRDRNLRLEHVEAMQRNIYKRKIFTEQAKRLLLEHAELQEEVSWRVEYLNSKWDMLEQSISPSKVASQKSFCADVEHEADCLKEWIREMERRLKPLNMHIAKDWNNQELVEKITEYEVLHKDIKAHGKVVAAVLKRAELAEATASVQLAKRLERRWHLLFLRALEWQFHLENLLKLRKHPLPEHLYSESDEEPLSKHPRLSSGDCSDHLTDDGSYFEDDIKDYWVKDGGSHSLPTPAKSASIMRRCSSFSEHSKDSKDTVINSPENAQRIPDEKSTIMKDVTEENSEIPVTVSTLSHHSVEMQNTGTSPMETETTSFSQSDRKAHNFATFYFKHRDTDSEQMQFRENFDGELASLNSKICEVKVCEDSSDEEWTYTSGKRTQVAKEKGNFLSSGISHLTSRKRNVAVRLDFGENVDKLSGSESARDNLQCHNSEDSIKGSGSADASCFDALTLPRSTEDTKECIQWLVRQAELLVREDSLMCSGEGQDPSEITSSQDRHARIKQWVKMHSALQDKFQFPDSCDASGEYTTGDSDEECSIESREESSGISLVNKHLDALLNTHPRLDSAEGFSDPNVTLRADNSPDSTDAKELCKVVTRSKQRCQRERPWSVSGISQLSSLPGRDDETGFTNFSTSESALHQMVAPNNNMIRDRQNSVVSSHGFQDNLSSSTVNESTKISSNGSLQRRRARQRKKTPQATCTKNDTACDAAQQQLASGSLSSSPKFKNLTKSTPKATSFKTQTGDLQIKSVEEKTRTFSETTCTSGTSEQITVSDSSVFPTESSSSKAVDAGDRTIGSEEEFFSRKPPGFLIFRLGPKEGAVTPKTDLIPHTLAQSGADSDMERTSGAHGADEQLSSSEQAWDNYQEKYMSEPYSEEIADSEVARRLLEFGDDYHNFLDSQSDCASSVEISQRASPQRKRKSIVGTGDSSVLDSDSDWEDIHHVIKQSQSHFIFTEQVLNKHVSKATPDMWVTDYAEIIATCKENKRCLRVILENVKEGEILSLKERKEIQELLEKWNALQVYADELQKVSVLQQRLINLRKRLVDVTAKISSLVDNLDDMTHLESAIQMLKEESVSLMDYKDQILQLNVAVHQLSIDCSSQSSTISTVMPQLKEDVTELYRIWSSSFQSVSSRLTQYERVVQTWQRFDKELSELQTTLQGDHSKLSYLCKSLDDGAAAVEDVAVSIRDIARLLSEVPGSSHRTHHSSSCQDLQEASVGTREGSLSDSGISDSGSENELSERARRLASLRQLANHLQTELGTSDGLVTHINERIEHLEHELQELQDVCRKLIVRTTFWAGMSRPESMPTSEVKVIENVPSTSLAVTVGKDTAECSSKLHQGRSGTSPEPGSCDSNTKASKRQRRLPWLWKVARAAIPVQLALVTLICLAYVFEPHCCENVNNLSLSLSPQLRYVYGPPPV